MKTIDLVYFNAGGGHRAAAQALQAVIAQQQGPWIVRCVNLVEMLDPLARLQRLADLAPQDRDNEGLAQGWTKGPARELRLLQTMLRMDGDALAQRLQRYWLRARPDLVVSLIPNFNRALCQSAATALPGVPYVTVMTDMADHPPHFWIEPDQPQHLVCGTDRAVEQARQLGCDRSRVHRTSGIVIGPEFYAPPALDRRAERAALGLDPDLPTGVVMFGDQCSMDMLTIARQLHDVPLLLMCGHHEALAGRLRRLNATAPHAVVGATFDMRRCLMLGDFFIGEPGSASLSQAVQLGLPVVTVRHAWTTPQERYNTDWVKAQGVGLVSPSIRRIRPAVLDLLERLELLRARVRRVRNRAVFEVPEILADLMVTGSHEAARAPVQSPAQAVH